MATLNVADLNRQGKVFVGANVSAKSVIAVTAAMTGLILWNPTGSGKKLVLVDLGFAYTTAPAALHNIGVAMMTASQVLPTSLTVAGRSAIAADGSGAIPAGIVWDAATLPAAPVAVRWFNGTLATGGVGNYQANDRVDGSLVVVPGAALCLTVVTTTAIGMGHFTWAEYNQ
jgi:hypothetical protein